MLFFIDLIQVNCYNLFHPGSIKNRFDLIFGRLRKNRSSARGCKKRMGLRSISFTMAVLALLLVVTPVLAFPPLPSSFWGTVTVNGQKVADGSVVQALIGGVVYATVLTEPYNGSSAYSLDIIGDDLSTPQIEGGREGDTITFKVRGAQADQTGTWHSGFNVEKNLTVSNFTNHAPAAVNDAFKAAQNRALTVYPVGVLANDTDADLDPLTAFLLTDPAHGTLTLRPDGTFDYAPVPDYLGTDTFTYRAFDGTSYSSPASVTITVVPNKIYLPCVRGE